MAFNSKPKKPISSSQTRLCTTLFFIVLFTIPALFLLHTPTTVSLCSTFSGHHVNPFSGDLLTAQFAWNRLPFDEFHRPPIPLKIAVFSRKWPIGTTPGGMERHAYTLHTALSRRGHEIHVFTSPPPYGDVQDLKNSHGSPSGSSPYIHCHEGEPGRWRYNKAWEQFVEENQREPFDVVHSESVALPHWLARNLQNLAVSWHGIALESLQSDIFQDLTRKPTEPMPPAFNKSVKIVRKVRYKTDNYS